MDTGDEDIGNIQLVGSSVGEAAPPLGKIRVENVITSVEFHMSQID